MPITIKLFLGEQDGREFLSRTLPDVFWIMTYEAREIEAQARRQGIELSDEEPLPRLPYVKSSVVKGPEGTVALYRFDESLLFPDEEEELHNGDTAQ